MKNHQITQEGSLGLLAAGDLALKAWRHVRDTGEQPKIVGPEPKERSDKKRLLVIGWDAADWEMINPLIDKGLMPTLKKLIEGGTMGNLRTLNPPYSPMLWTSIATGKRPDKHGILGFTEPDPSTGDIRPVQSSSRKCRAIWNILGHLGYKVNVVGWWPSHPAEPVNGAMVSNFFPNLSSADPATWPMQKGSVFPENIAEELASLRVHPSEITPAHVFPFIPNARMINQDEDTSIAYLRKHLAKAASYQAATTHLMRNTEWDVTAVYFDTIDRMCHKFMRFLPPRMKPVPEDKYHIYKKVMPGIYRFHDMMLAQQLELAGEDCNVLLLSDHGFYTGNRLLAKKPKVSAAIALDHKPQGIFCLNGKDVKKDELVHGASLLDITPTLLALLGEKVGQDMDGKVLTQCFEKPLKIESLESWDKVKGNFGEHSEYMKTDPTYAKEALQQLVNLGYIEELDDDAQERLEKVTRDNRISLATAYADNNRLGAALKILEEAYEEDRVSSRINLQLIDWYCLKKKPRKAREVLTNFKKFSMDKTIDFDVLEAKILLYENEFEKVLKKCDILLKHKPGLRIAQSYRAMALRSTGRFDEAEKIYEKLLLGGTENEGHLLNLGICQLKQQKYEAAAVSLLKAIGLDFNLTNAHYQLGITLQHLGKYQEAAQALENCLHLNPSVNKARNLLVKIYAQDLEEKEKSLQHQKVFYQGNQEETVFVSGLPRTGTSMMMQMLQAGGMPLLADLKREPDESNPMGYLEYEPVKKSNRNNNWLDDAKGKAVKVVAPLLPKMKIDRPCKVIFMQREMSEVMRSQQQMLSRLQPNMKTSSSAYDLRMSETFRLISEKAIAWVEGKASFELLQLDYAKTVEQPMETAEKVAEFLGYPLNVQAMAQIVKKELYRERQHTVTEN